MGSLEDDQLVQMVRDFIESESPSPTNSTSSKCRALTHRTQCFMLQDILRSETRAEAKVRNYVLNLKRMRGRSDAKNPSRLRKWLVLRMKMDGLDASLCHTCWATSLGCPAGEYEYVEVNITEGENGSPERVIVDIDFRSQFELARPTQYYREMTESLPVIFVGTENKLSRIISLLCSAAKQSLREKGLHVPPWRTTSYMQSKWFSGRHHEEPCPQEQGVGTGERYGGVREAEGEDEIGEWVPPIVKPRKRDLGGGSGLSKQFSDLTINCC
ncbi:uncharacterized protein LOC114723957 [Neltuma alba]|uniref:uncharacterized protein LOC114723957 n=1 Tax=Neltuma alba TaxID=207710 RepID=UPI0010A2B56A|nr:uncharacterized protein LOC114723957 [Prosopis alba]XP_028766052.1 uncharacterized protein LOC114723957 [Prosopis alba]